MGLDTIIIIFLWFLNVIIVDIAFVKIICRIMTSLCLVSSFSSFNLSLLLFRVTYFILFHCQLFAKAATE